MIKRALLFIALAAMIGTALPSTAVAGRGVTGRITDVSATSISVRDKEVVTFTLDSRTHYTKWITQKPWGEDTRLDAATSNDETARNRLVCNLHARVSGIAAISGTRWAVG